MGEAELKQAMTGELDPSSVSRADAAELALALVEMSSIRFGTLEYAEGARLSVQAGRFAARAAEPRAESETGRTRRFDDHGNVTHAGPILTLKVKRIRPEAKLPTRATSGSGGWDLYACEADNLVGRTEVSTGIAVEIPRGFVGLMRGRSGLARRGVRCFEGTIDSDYRGELRVLLTRISATPKLHGVLVNRGEPVPINVGDRIAQLVIVPVPEIEIVEVEELSQTERGEGGMGSTGR